MRRHMRLLVTVLTLIGVGTLAACESDAPTTPDGLDVRASSTADSHFEDEDSNGIPDEGETVTGAYKSVYAYDANGDWYWDLGDGRVRGTVNSVGELDQSTLTVCDYQIQYRGNFENDPFLDSGWVKNNINCSGYDDNGNYNYTIVHETDPRYTGEKLPAFGGDWEYSVYAVKGQGNIVNPHAP